MTVKTLGKVYLRLMAHRSSAEISQEQQEGRET
jgi:hypothetical protein